VPVGGAWATIDHAAGHDYADLHFGAATKTLTALMKEGEIVEETDLVLRDDRVREWLLVGCVE
jgi:hypothetical protein